MRSWIFVCLVALLLLFGSTPKSTLAEVDYLREVKPILQKHCYACHGVLKQQSNLRLDTVASMRRGGESGELIVVPRHPNESLLYQVVTGAADFRMPPENEGSPLDAVELKVVGQWIAEGANAPTDEQPQADPATYWSYQVPIRPPLPQVGNSVWARTPVDNFIAAQHERRKLTPNPTAKKTVLLRRVYLDLIGLPPTRAELLAFVADNSPRAFEQVVDDLLSRPAYGQRWGRHWMDVWRYSDWYGRRGSNEIRYSQRHIWRWRDWIVKSLNKDKGYDQMIIEMLAGDELAPGDMDVAVATGFLGRNWYKFDRNVWMFDTVERTSQSLLGLTLRCCRCHDHKYDPISHEDYYRFRAFFEPHGVRTDRVSADTATEVDNGKNTVLQDGLSFVFDKELDRPTYRFVRGDGRYPDKGKELSPGVPVSLGNQEIAIEPVSLPPEAFYPALREPLKNGIIEEFTAKLTLAESAVHKAEQVVIRAKSDLNAFVADASGNSGEGAKPFLVEDFAKSNPDLWKILNGDWVYEDGKLIEKEDTSFATIVTKQRHPRNFRASLTYRPLQPGSYRSIGFSFDFIDTGNSQDVYTATSDASQSVQAFHRENGKQSYPQAGIVPVKLKVGELAKVEVTARGQDLKIWLNGELKLEYVMPVKRRDGKFALWVHKGTAEFHQLEIKPLIATVDDLRKQHCDAVNAVAMKKLQVLTARTELDALKARIAAEQGKYGNASDDERAELAKAASKKERTVLVRRAEESALKAKHYLAATLATHPSAAAKKALASAQQKMVAAEQNLADAKKAEQIPDVNYKPLGKLYPQTSSGRRLALARWITGRQNPRTARIAVNHIWLRHFGEALVPSVANFGLNGKRPSHPELLDWLAVELIESNWSMKHLHRLIVLSSAYRMSSSSVGSSNLHAIDPDNRFLWRMNSQRMEAELLRDSILAVSGALDLSHGGPDIPENQGETVLRRSMYFRLTPDSKMKFLELFDVADPNSCYRRIESVVPQQALAIINSRLVQTQARFLSDQLSTPISDDASDERFVTAAFETIMARPPNSDELAACGNFLTTHTELLQRNDLSPLSPGGSKQLDANAAHKRARENLVHVLMNHNDFVTIR